MKNNKKVTAILFDKDGTLLDFNACWRQPYLLAADYLAKSAGDASLATELMTQGGYIEDSQTWVSDSVLASGNNRQITHLWESIIGKPITNAQQQKIATYFNLATQNLVPAIADMKAYLERLQSTGLILGVATMDNEQHALNTLEQLNIQHCFDFVCGADSGYGSKPDSGMISGFCHHINVNANEIMMVGDSPKDIIMGNNAAVAYSVGVLTGAHKYADLKPYTDYIYSDISAMTVLLD